VRPVDSAADMSRVPDGSLASDGSSEATDSRPVEKRDVPKPPESLRQRLDELPPGHPSSPYDADGGRRQPVPRLRDLEIADDETVADPERTQAPDEQFNDASANEIDEVEPTNASDEDTERLEVDPGTVPPPDSRPDITEGRSPDEPWRHTDAEWDEHVGEVRDSLDKAQADGLSTDKRHTIDPAREIWSDERDLVHDSIISDLYAESSNVPCEFKAIIAGGLAGAGKTTVLESYADIDRSQYLTINPDDIKEELARRGLVPDVAGLSPMEASDLVHEESSYLARQLASRARADGKNIIWDITMSSRSSAEQRIDDLRADGYASIEGIFVDIPVDVSTRRTDARHREGQDKYRIGIGMGGRYIPPEVISAQADANWGSKNRRTFEELKPSCDRWTLYDNSVDDRDPVLADVSPSDHP
jgi:predicted ABC-type ATPase